ncbi:MAG: hypothetical protein HOK21_23735 [Rhodospirillaceae bacterium]|jgi:hypothetical protein|nr:hypothetical protein [Rhodospirillaceae bacterium]MBT4042218.1 hypothetical protein [Rhodospirillaceae bacterium]MBT4687488.1 hypothetical protein [Rhodospirillaceae bacterium]MBT5080190.1 hypothetical protein [Rhodospirillaceae bacterium]MBT5527111.1 hypothetical protein [Rhodospirillaceae bacterium]
MTSNVIQLPGVGYGPQLPVRPAADTAVQASKSSQSTSSEQNFVAPKDSHGTDDGRNHGGETKSSSAARPQSPVDLNSLLSAQEHGNAPEQSNSQPASLSEEQQKQVSQLQKADAEIHRHEQAHAAAGGQYAGSPQYSYTNGPDGGRYATSGHVSIDVSAVAGDPKATIAKMDVVQRAANAPAEPSSADRSVSAQAASTKQAAQIELSQQKAAEKAEAAEDDTANGTTNTAADATANARGETSGAGPGNGFVPGFVFGETPGLDREAGDAARKPTASDAAASVSPAAAAAAYAAAPMSSIIGS